MPSQSRPCRYYLKTGYCKADTTCQYMHVNHDGDVFCPDYWDCRTNGCSCLHPSDEEKYKHFQRLTEVQRRQDEYQFRQLEAKRNQEQAKLEEEQAKAEAQRLQLEAQQKETARIKAQFIKRIDEEARMRMLDREGERQRAAENKQHALLLASNRKMWLDYADEQLRLWKADNTDFTDVYRQLTETSAAFAQAVATARSKTPVKRRRLSNGKFAPSFPRISIGLDYNIIKLLWMDFLTVRDVLDPDWDEDVDDDEELRVEHFDRHFTWDEENDEHITAFREFIAFCFTYSDLGDHDAKRFLCWVTKYLKIVHPSYLACILYYGFQLPIKSSISIITEWMAYYHNNFSVANYRILFKGWTYQQIDKLLDTIGNDLTIEMLLPLDTKKAGKLIRYRYLDIGYKERDYFETFGERYSKVMDILYGVQDTKIFHSLYRAILDGFYSRRHYDAAMESRNENNRADTALLKWEFAEVDANLRKQWRIWNNKHQVVRCSKSCDHFYDSSSEGELSDLSESESEVDASETENGDNSESD